MVRMSESKCCSLFLICWSKNSPAEPEALWLEALQRGLNMLFGKPLFIHAAKFCVRT
jgi:hypothetical protein